MAFRELAFAGLGRAPRNPRQSPSALESTRTLVTTTTSHASRRGYVARSPSSAQGGGNNIRGRFTSTTVILFQLHQVAKGVLQVQSCGPGKTTGSQREHPLRQTARAGVQATR